MGHGYFIVLARGIVLSIAAVNEAFAPDEDDEEFEDYPFSATERKDYDGETIYSDNPDVIEEIEEKYRIRLHFEQQGAPTDVFICTRQEYEMDARDGGYEEVDTDFLMKGAKRFDSVIAKLFPKGPKPQLMLYSYQGD